MNAVREDTWLLAVDGSRGADNAARYAARSAQALGVKHVRIVNVRFPSVGAQRQSAAARRAQALRDAERASARARKMLAAAGVRFDLAAPIGDDPAAMIVGAAESLDAAEIVMGTRGVSMLSSVMLGSVAYKVVHMARRAVTLVPERARGGARDPLALLVAVDGSNAANHAVQYAARQAVASPRVRVLLLNVQPDVYARNARLGSIAQFEAHVEEQAAAATRQAERILRRAGIAFGRRVARGEAVRTIIETAASSECGHIVLGTRGRGAARALVLGSVAYGVVHQADVPVTVVRQPLPAPVLLPGSAGER
jgi:nucleotide-binding universal stress UspA family protein